MEKLTRRFGLFTAVCTVVGTVIGSGVFFKAQDVLKATGGRLLPGIAAWGITGLIMMICSAQFALMATKYEHIGGAVDYAEATCGKTYSYYLAWFLTNIYYPGMTSVVSWVSARYFGAIFGWEMTEAHIMLFAGFFLIMSCTVNAISPRLAGHFQISATVIKLVPIVLMALIGSAVGLWNGTLSENFTNTVTAAVDNSAGSGLFAAVVATLFAYEGWIVATSIHAELKDPQKTLPSALILGSIIVVFAYVAYYLGVAGGASNAVLMKEGAAVAFRNVFGALGGTFLSICVVVSCLGTLNGLMMGATRGMYAIAARGEGPSPEIFAQVDKATHMTANSAIWGLFISAVWLVYFYGANLAPEGGWFGYFNFDSSELPIVTIYAIYIPMFVMWMKKEKELGFVKRFLLPSLSILACAFMVFAAVYAHGITPYRAAKEAGEFSLPVLFYLIVFAAIMLIGYFCSNAFQNKIKKK